MERTEIKVTNTIKASYSYETRSNYPLDKPSLPDGCEEWGAYKGSSFENRIMNLICLKCKKDKRFFCEECFEKIKPKDLDRQLVDWNADTNIRLRLLWRHYVNGVLEVTQHKHYNEETKIVQSWQDHFSDINS